MGGVQRAAAPASRGSRLVLCALALVLGLLGMHGLASEHAAMPGMPPAHGVTAAAVPLHSVLAPAPADHAPGGMAGLCLAVLGGGMVVLLALSAAVGRAGGRDVVSRSRAARAPGRLALLRPPDPVAGLCVSRT